MKDCCRPDENPGPIKRLLNGATVLVLVLLALAALASVILT